MNKEILKTGVQNFIDKKWSADIMSVLLKKPFFDGISNRELAQQLEAKKKCEKKLPTWFSARQIYYPDKLNIEQTSSEVTAKYKAEIVGGKSLVDLTGGLGVDTYFFSQKIEQVFHCEINAELSQIATHNFDVLGAVNIRTITEDGFAFLQQKKKRFDWIYIDPSRRNGLKGKVYRFSDSVPNIVGQLDTLFKKSDNVLIKSSPLVDLSAGIGELQFVKEIHVVAVHNELKELLWVLEKNFKGEVEIKTINFSKTGKKVFDYKFSEEKKAVPHFSEPLKFLYEPNAAIMKAGAFKIIGNRFQLKKLHPHTHLYTSDKSIDFPGRAFLVEKTFPYNKKNIRQLRLGKANITIRNFPETVASLRKKYHIRDGGGVYLFFTKIKIDKLVVLLCSKIQRPT